MFQYNQCEAVKLIHRTYKVSLHNIGIGKACIVGCLTKKIKVDFHGGSARLQSFKQTLTSLHLSNGQVRQIKIINKKNMRVIKGLKKFFL
jgi:hypothetical protein